MPMLQEITDVRSPNVRAVPSQIAELPVLSAAELCALNAMTHPVLDKPALDWWGSQDDQPNLTQMAYSELARRQLFDPAAQKAAPPLDLILAARTNPVFTVVTRDKPDAEPRPERVYAAADVFGKRAVLLEQARPNPASWSGLAYSYQLTKIQAQADAIIEWASARKGRTIDCYLPGAGTGGVSGLAERLVVTRAAARNGQISYHRETCDSTFTAAPVCLTALLVSFMSGLPYLPAFLPISY